jgi:hypothetical protein
VAAASGTHRKTSSSWQRIDLGTTAPLLQLRWAASCGDVCERWRRWAPTSAAAQLADRSLPRAPAPCCDRVTSGRRRCNQFEQRWGRQTGGSKTRQKEHNHQSQTLRRDDESVVPARASPPPHPASALGASTVLEHMRCTAHWRLTADPASIDARALTHPSSIHHPSSVARPIDPFTE